MITIRRLLLFSFLALLAGCYTSPCEGPGQGHGTGQYCHYRFEITNDVSASDTWLVQGVVPDQVYKDAEASVPKEKKTFFFYVRDLEKLRSQIQKGQAYNFNGQDDSSYVELLPDYYKYDSQKVNNP